MEGKKWEEGERVVGAIRDPTSYSIDPAESRKVALKSVYLASEVNFCSATTETWIQQETSAVFVTLPFLL